MFLLTELLSELDDETVFSQASEAFLQSRKKLIESLVEKKDVQGLANLLEEDRSNLSSLNSLLKNKTDTIANLQKIKQYNI